MKNSIAHVASLLAVICMAAACEQTPIENPAPQAAQTVSFVISDQGVTKASVLETSVNRLEVEPINGVEYVIEETATPMDCLFGYMPMTKGTPAYTENVADLYGKFSGIAYIPGTETVKYPAAEFTPSGIEGNWEHQYADFVWPSEGYRFFMQMPVAECAALAPQYGTDGKISFDFTSPTEATAQKDLLFTSKLCKADHETLVFFHALAAVRFEIGTKGEGVKGISKIELTGLKNAGSCVITPDYSKTSADNVKWSDRSGSVSYSVSFTGKEQEGQDLSGGTTFPSEFYASTSSSLNNADFTKTFNIIPQVVGEDVKAVLTVELTDGTQVTRTVQFGSNLKLANKEWLAGTLYTYKFTVKNDIEIEVEEEFDKTTKSNVDVKNTGDVDAFIRAIIVANWVDADGVVVAPFANEGTMTPSSSSKWVKSGAYYYYNEAVEPGCSTENLFDSYTYTSEQVPVEGAHLEMTIASQAVAAVPGKTYDEVWGL